MSSFFCILGKNIYITMATIEANDDTIQITMSNSDVYLIKKGNVKLIKTDTINIYDNSENRRGTDAIRLKHSEVTSPITTDLQELYITIRNFID